MINQIKKILKNEDGAEALEYVVIVASIIIVGAAAYTPGITNLLSTSFSTIISVVTDATTP